jgi:hypothetical protein
MALNVRSVEYYYATVQDMPGQAAELLKLLQDGGVDLLAFSIVPTGPTHTQLMLFPEAPAKLIQTTKRAGLQLTGPQHALMVTGAHALGALVGIHQRLADNNINIYASNGVVDAVGGFGYVMYVRPEDFKLAAKVAGVEGAPSYHPAPILKK